MYVSQFCFLTPANRISGLLWRMCKEQVRHQEEPFLNHQNETSQGFLEVCGGGMREICFE